MGCGSSAQPVLFQLVEAGNDSKLRAHLRASPNCTKETNHLGDSCLHHAAYMEPGNEGTCMAALLEAGGSSPNATNKAGWTALHYAAAYGKSEAMKLLLKGAAKDDIKEPSGQTAIHYAVEKDKALCVEAAVACGANCETFNQAGLTPLHLAGRMGRDACVAAFLAAKPPPSLEVKAEGTGNTPLHEAAVAGNMSTVELLLGAGADREARNSNGQAPRDLAGTGGHSAVAAKLGAAPKEEDMIAGKAAAASGGGSVNSGDPEGLQPASEATRLRVQNMFDETWKGQTTRDRQFEKVKKFEVVQVLQNHNATLWNSYAEKREAIALHFVEPLGDIKTVTELWEQGLQDLRQANANEFFLFHGSKPQAVQAICNTDFRLDLSGCNKGSLYGPGIYFAESSSKADEYAEDDKDGIYKGLYAMLLCRVTLGNPFICKEVEPDVAMLTEALAADDKHCIVGDREAIRGTYREFIVRDKDQAYPAYVIIYRRKE